MRQYEKSRGQAYRCRCAGCGGEAKRVLAFTRIKVGAAQPYVRFLKHMSQATKHKKMTLHPWHTIGPVSIPSDVIERRHLPSGDKNIIQAGHVRS